jgi:hypothetical protein
MADSKTKRCPRCGGEIDYFDTCRRCGREWSEHLEEGEQASGLPEGEQHPAETKKVDKRKPRKNRFTKSGKRLQGREFVSFNPEVAPQFQPWQIDASSDSDDEIIRKRSLMRLDAHKQYNTLGLSLRAHEYAKGALLWFSRLWELLSDDERKNLVPTMDNLKKAFAGIREVSRAKVAETAQMEKALERAHNDSRRARLRIETEKAKQVAAKKILPQQDSEGLGVNPLEIDPKLLATLTKEELIELAKERLATLDQEKALRKRREKPEEPTEEPE